MKCSPFGDKGYKIIIWITSLLKSLHHSKESASVSDIYSLNIHHQQQINHSQWEGLHATEAIYSFYLCHYVVGHFANIKWPRTETDWCMLGELSYLSACLVLFLLVGASCLTLTRHTNIYTLMLSPKVSIIYLLSTLSFFEFLIIPGPLPTSQANHYCPEI